MAPLFQKPRVTEIHVRMDCNGCVHRIKKSLNGISGINDLYIDFPQQKITIIGWADPENVIKAIRRTGKIATICPPVHVEEPTQSPSQATEEAPEETKQHEQPPDEDEASEQSQNNLETEDVETYEDPPYNGNRYGCGDRQSRPPMYVTHSYNTYQPSPYVTEYENVRSPNHTHYYSPMEHYSSIGDYYYYNDNANANLTSMFSDENPNSCTIV